MNILIVNDDGVTDSINILRGILKKQGHKVIQVTPDRNRSGSGAAITVQSNIKLEKLDEQIYTISGTPVDCVHVGLHLADSQHIKIDMLISGPNNGENLADDWLYSGTLCAALEANRIGIKSLAISLIGELDNKLIESKLNYILGLDFTDELSKGVVSINVPLVTRVDRDSKIVKAVDSVREHEFSINSIDSNTLRIGVIGKVINSSPYTDQNIVDSGDISYSVLNF